MPFPWRAARPITTRSLDPLFLGLLAAFSEHPRQVDAGAYVQLAEDLAKMEGDGVRAQEHLVRDPLIRQALGDQIRHCAFGIGQAGPAGPGPVGMREMPAPDADPARPPSHPPAVAQRRGLVIAGQRRLEIPAALGKVLSPDEQYPEVLRR